MYQKNKSGSAGVLALGILLTVFGFLFSVIFAFNIPPNLLTAEDKDIDTQSLDAYYIEKMLVISKYGSNTYDGWSYDEDYYIVSFYSEKDDASYLASLKVDESATNLYNKLNDYYNDDSKTVGDCYIDVCVTAYSLDTLDSDIYEYYKEAEEACVADYKFMNKTDISLEYYCNTPSDYLSQAKSDMEINDFCLSFTSSLYIIGISLIVEEKRKKNIQKAFYNFMGLTGTYYTPGTQQNQKNYYTPPQNSEGNSYNNSRDYSNGGDYQQ